MAVPIPTILKEIASKSKKDEKKEVLLKYANNGAFREILKYAFDQFSDRDYLIITQPHTVVESMLL